MWTRSQIVILVQLALLLDTSAAFSQELHICSATAGGHVDCSGSVFNLNISGERGRSFVISYLNRRFAEWRAAALPKTDAEVEAHIAKVHQRWAAQDLQPTLDAIGRYIAQDEARGLLDQQRDADARRRTETLEQKLDLLLQLRDADAEATNARFEALEVELAELRASNWLGPPYRLGHRLFLGGYYGLEAPLAASLHTFGVSFGYRFPGRWILSPTLRVYGGQGSNEAPVTGGEPSAISVGSIDRVDIDSFGFEACGAFGYEWQTIVLAFSTGLRGETSTYDPAIESGRTSHVRGLQLPARVELDLHLFSRVFLHVAAGWVFIPNHQPLQYELDPAGQRLKLSPKSDLRASNGVMLGGRYALDL